VSIFLLFIIIDQRGLVQIHASRYVSFLSKSVSRSLPFRSLLYKRCDGSFALFLSVFSPSPLAAMSARTKQAPVLKRKTITVAQANCIRSLYTHSNKILAALGALNHQWTMLSDDDQDSDQGSVVGGADQLGERLGEGGAEEGGGRDAGVRPLSPPAAAVALAWPIRARGHTPARAPLTTSRVFCA